MGSNGWSIGSVETDEGVTVGGGWSLTDLSEGEKDSAGIKPNLAGSMPNMARSETNIVGFEKIYNKHCQI